ncbi:MAG TPA: hypothetical protein VFP95_00370 [Gammaproteobacteria bacterium]|nr:hypothetical protein [Gammaproteobacteria bacterium]
MNDWDIDPNLYRSLFSSFRLSLAPRRAPARTGQPQKSTNVVQPKPAATTGKVEECCAPTCCAS